MAAKLQDFLRVNKKTENRLKNKSVYFSRPCLVAIYDIDYDKITLANKIQYFREPKPTEYPLNLNGSLDTFYPLTCGRTFKTRLLPALLHTMATGAEAAGDYNQIDCKLKDVYTRSGVLKYIMEFYYGNYSNFNVLISRYNDKLFMINKNSENTEQKVFSKMVHSRHKSLHQLMFVDSPNGSPNRNEPIDENVAQVAVHRSTLGKYNLTYAGEVQGIISDVEINDVGDINALNEMRFVFTKQMWSTLKGKEFKLLKYWLQAYLANVGEIYMAYKNTHGVIEEPIEHVKVADITKSCSWKPGICTAFLYEFLEKVDLLMSNVNSLDTVYEFHFNSKDKTIQYEVLLESPENAIIPKEYSEFIKKANES